MFKNSVIKPALAGISGGAGFAIALVLMFFCLNWIFDPGVKLVPPDEVIVINGKQWLLPTINYHNDRFIIQDTPHGIMTTQMPWGCREVDENSAPARLSGTFELLVDATDLDNNSETQWLLERTLQTGTEIYALDFKFLGNRQLTAYFSRRDVSMDLIPVSLMR